MSQARIVSGTVCMKEALIFPWTTLHGSDRMFNSLKWTVYKIWGCLIESDFSSILNCPGMTS